MYARIFQEKIYTDYTEDRIRIEKPQLPEELSDELLAEHGFYPQVDNIPTINDYQYYGETEITFDGTTVNVTKEVIDRPLQDVKSELKARAKQIRKYKEERGLQIAEGHTIYTNREDQSMIMGVIMSFQMGLVSTVNFKTREGFIELDQSGIMNVAAMIAAHVQGCFTEEAGWCQAIDTSENVEQLQAVSNVIESSLI